MYKAISKGIKIGDGYPIAVVIALQTISIGIWQQQTRVPWWNDIFCASSFECPFFLASSQTAISKRMSRPVIPAIQIETVSANN